MGKVNVSNWDNTLQVGEEFELQVLKICKGKDPLAYKEKGNVKTHDLVLPKYNNLKVECKSDEKSAYTGNFFIECEFNGRPSGIDATHSKLWVHGSKENIYVLSTVVLKQLVEHYSKVISEGEDGTVVKGYKIPVYIIELNSIVIRPRYES